MDTGQYKFLIALKLLMGVHGLGPGKVINLIRNFQHPENVLSAGYHALINTEGISPNLAKKIAVQKKLYHEISRKTEEELTIISKMNGEITTFWWPDYPPLLRKIYHPPLIFRYLGNFVKADSNSLAIVGTRQATRYGKMQTEFFVEGLTSHDITIVSGLARGIDSAAHTSAVKRAKRTIAVLGSGLDNIYPPENRELFYRIIENGVVMTEYEIGTKPDAQNFPKRNRIISGLSLGTLVMETGVNGGAVQTAHYALDQNREVFAVPGDLGKFQSEGTNLLIQKGEAKLVTNHDDILVELELKLKPIVGKNIPPPVVDLNFFEQKIIEHLNTTPIHIDKISEISALSIPECLVALLSLEFKGIIRQAPGKLFYRCR